MKKLAFALLALPLAHMLSCSKTSMKEEFQSSLLTKHPGSPSFDRPVTMQYPSDLALIPLINNHDGTWTGNCAGMRMRFTGFQYEVFTDVNGNPVPPKVKDPAWPSGIGPEPGVTNPNDFNCLNTILWPDIGQNQYTVQVICQMVSGIYYPGAGYQSFGDQVQSNWADYQTARENYNILIANGIPVNPPAVPSSPFIIPYILQDYVIPQQGPVLTARFGIYSYDPATQEVIFGIDAR